MLHVPKFIPIIEIEIEFASKRTQVLYPNRSDVFFHRFVDRFGLRFFSGGFNDLFQQFLVQIKRGSHHNTS